MNSSSNPPTMGNSVRCPFLGLHDDPKTSLAYPSPWNYCYRASPPAPIAVAHQMSACLGRDHTQCRVFLATTPAELPRDLRSAGVPINRRGRSRNSLLWFVSLTVLLGVLLVLTGLRLRSNMKIPAFPTETLSDQPTQIESMQSSGMLGVPTMTAETKPFASTQMDEKICGHALDIPFGGEVRFVIHKVAKGENLNMYGDQFETTTDAISAINHEMRMPIWEDAVVVIPIGTTLVIGIPQFEVYQQMLINISIDELADELGTDPGDFREFNGFDDSCVAFSGWILIPRERIEP